MSDTVIKVENLGKKYIIGHQKQEKYTALRDVISNSVKSILQPNSKSKNTKEEFWALKDINFEIKQGDRVGIIGRNGAGKSTLLKVLSRITEPTTGQIKIKGRVASLLEVGTGFHPELTGRENIFLNGAILGMGKAEIKKKFDEIVAFAEVEKFLDTPVKRYSSGMYVRLAFAVAAHLEPEILIVDEVLAVGDAQFQKKCLGKMEDVGKEGSTVIFVSHNMSTVNSLCQKTIWLDRGTIKMQGNIEEIISQYLLHGTQHNGQITFDNPIKNNFRLQKISLFNSKKEISSIFSVKEPILIRIEYQVTKLIKNVEVSLRIHNSHGIPIFTTNRSSSVLSEIKIGINISEIIIPSLFLVPDSYIIEFGVHVPNVEIIYHNQSLLAFKIEETGSAMAIYKNVNYGLVFVNIPWKEYIEQDKLNYFA